MENGCATSPPAGRRHGGGWELDFSLIFAVRTRLSTWTYSHKTVGARLFLVPLRTNLRLLHTQLPGTGQLQFKFSYPGSFCPGKPDSLDSPESKSYPCVLTSLIEPKQAVDSAISSALLLVIRTDW